MRASLLALVCLGLAATAPAQVNQFVGVPPNATNTLDFDNPFVPSGPIAPNDVTFTSVGIASVNNVGVWLAGGDTMTAASNVMGQGLVSQAGVLSVAGPGEALDNPQAGASFDVSLAGPASEFGALFVDQINFDYTVELFDQGGTNSLGVGFFNYSGSFPSPAHYWTGPGNFDRIVITWPNTTFGVGLDNFAFDMAGAPGCLGTYFQCTSTVPNSRGVPAEICATGSVVCADNNLTLTCTDMPANQFGYFLNSPNMNIAGFVPPGSQGRLCIGPQCIGRHVSQIQNSGSAQMISIQVDLTAIPTCNGPMVCLPGLTWYWQCWFRDNNPGPTSNFSDAVCIMFQ